MNDETNTNVSTTTDTAADSPETAKSFSEWLETPLGKAACIGVMVVLVVYATVNW